jgi:UDP-N-acetylglucosamine--N-acetylmuramyl-(pentapeptide) pyrophosphoryl-undecaprenol N-acetylglucosamine transferase
MKICITGGGTGGHLMIAEALAEAGVRSGHEMIFIGSTNGQDRKYFEKYSDFAHVYFLNTTGVVNQKWFKKPIALFKIFRAFFSARSILKKHDVVATYSVGGFSAAPASFASLSMFLPFFIHEQNAVEGRLNKLLKPFAKRFISAYDSKSKIQGYPVKEVFFKTARKREGLDTIIFLGGSHGAKAINDLALSTCKELDKRGIKIIHQAGEADFERVRDAYKEMGVEVELYAFTKELPSLIARADFAVSRAGASTLWELTSNGCPALFVPYPYAAGDHQYYNAKFIVDNNMGWCEREGDTLKDRLLELLDEDMSQKSQNLLTYSVEDVAKKMIQDLQSEVDA